MNTISAILHQAKYASSEQPVMAVDGVPIYQWITSRIFDQDGTDTTSDLVPAQVWLMDDAPRKLAWKLLVPVEDSSTVVPLLVCPDDMDLHCTVIVVEQVVDKDLVIWKRFGRGVNHLNGIVTSVDWSGTEQSAMFSRDQFEKAVLDFRNLTPD